MAITSSLIWSALLTGAGTVDTWTAGSIDVTKALVVVEVDASSSIRDLISNSFELASAHVSSSSTSQSVTDDCGVNRPYECRCVERKKLLETLAKELPYGTIRFSSKLLSIHHQQSTGFKSAIRGLVQSPPDGGGHGLEPRFHVYFGGGVRFGFVPCGNEEEFEEGEAMKMKQFVLNKARNAPKEMLTVVERIGLDAISCSELKLRPSWNLLRGNIVKDSVFIVGDALHPNAPDIGQDACFSLEDRVILARCIGEDMMMKKKDYDKFFGGLAYMMGVIQESGGKVMSFLREPVYSIFP
ncbi:monooxygenase 2-like [Impatiens glandulifera]|uniref:monooxygenase 2-like n=1 Tax=Impatiens glandulifera TaxID=253017 RepID=UPI001FB14721|nr:monooxygenase 2-like [Impatiens glandulifera]